MSRNNIDVRPPGKKAALPSRTPLGYALPDLKEIYFADDLVLQALIKGGLRNRAIRLNVTAKPADQAALKKNKEKGHEARVAAQALMKRRAFDRILWREQMQRKKIHDEISWAVSHYISSTERGPMDRKAKGFAISPKAFRQSVKNFRAALQRLVEKLENERMTFVEAAIKAELHGQSAADPQDSLDFDLWKASLRKVVVATDAVAASEKRGRGRQANRSANKLVDDLARIFTNLTGEPPTRGTSATIKNPNNRRPVLTTPFGKFVQAVDNLIPKDFKLPEIDNLVRQHIKRAN